MNNFITRLNPNKTEQVDYMKLIDSVLNASEFNRLIPDSPIYLLAVQQYNNQVAKNTLVRKPIPKWFCGKVNVNNGILTTPYSDEALRAINGYTTTTLLPASGYTIINSIPYADDACLQSGTPGSDGYAICNPNIRNINSSFTSVLCGVEFDNLINLVN